MAPAQRSRCIPPLGLYTKTRFLVFEQKDIVAKIAAQIKRVLGVEAVIDLCVEIVKVIAGAFELRIPEDRFGDHVHIGSAGGDDKRTRVFLNGTLHGKAGGDETDA